MKFVSLFVVLSFVSVFSSSVSFGLESQSISIQAKSQEQACAAAKQSVRPGDLIFIQIDNLIYRKLVAEVTDSWASHVGVVFQGPKGWIVSESTFPWAKETELCKFLKRTKGTRFEIRRLKGLTSEDVELLRVQANQRLGQSYDTGFNFDEVGTSFCSKFTYEVFQEALGVSVGSIETLAQIRDRKLAKDPEYDYTFVYVWFLRLRIPWERRTVTPESQRIDPKLVTILESI